MVENSSAGLVMLEAAVLVTVTREEYHQAVLSRYRVAPGASRSVAVELGWCAIGTGKHRGERAIEVRLDGHRVGELTHLMTQRYGALVAQAAARGGTPGCEAMIQLGDKGLEVILRLPRRTSGAMPFPATRPVPPPVPFPGSAPEAAVPPAPPAPRWRRPAWIAASVVAGIILIAALVGQEDDPAPSTADDSTTTAITTTTTLPPTATTTVAPKPVVPKPKPAPKPTTEAPAPPPPEPEPEPQPACDPNYSGCVPVAPDVDCAGGSGNGPAYVQGPVTVIGSDIYDLDRDGDGTGCDS
ncbi:MAG: hypothetical protein GEV28_26795 [Actinophytocola sp.]|uniref:hypothetical protein n=1 Tax=Actinophytocola sp. TaxID=1872138 RepID=UPI00132B1267|nr:hypothetical protein [Actinophytocola sp.]MPZ83804.1 hypothetical protein [Actinophytocola sp.]